MIRIDLQRKMIWFVEDDDWVLHTTYLPVHRFDKPRLANFLGHLMVLSLLPAPLDYYPN